MSTEAYQCQSCDGWHTGFIRVCLNDKCGAVLQDETETVDLQVERDAAPVCDVCFTVSWEATPEGVRCGYCWLHERVIQLTAEQDTPRTALRNNFRQHHPLLDERVRWIACKAARATLEEP